MGVPRGTVARDNQVLAATTASSLDRGHRLIFHPVGDFGGGAIDVGLHIGARELVAGGGKVLT